MDLTFQGRSLRRFRHWIIIFTAKLILHHFLFCEHSNTTPVTNAFHSTVCMVLLIKVRATEVS